jgi:DNA invertase Pin-like site-specific DNA recombinase
MLIGYARVSTFEQTLNLQKDALTKAGCSKIFTDTASGAKAERKGLAEALRYIRQGDTLVVWRLDRLGRSLPHLITTMTDLEERRRHPIAEILQALKVSKATSYRSIKTRDTGR